MKRNIFIRECDFFSINKNDCVEKAIKVINNGGIQICLVFGEDKQFEGIVTDSDLRRGILNGISTTSNVTDVMNVNPIKVKEILSEEKINNIMMKNHIFHIPVISEENIFKGIFVSDNLIEENLIDEIFFILAGGKGKRMGQLTKNIPKPMLTINGKPMIELIIMNAKEYGFRNFVISIGYLGEVIKDYFGNGEKHGVKISYIEEDQPLGTAGSLSYLKNKELSEYIFVTNGDVVTNLEYSNMLNFAKDRKCDGVIGVKEYEMKNPFGVIESVNGDLVDISEKPTYKSTINAGVYVISKRLISLISIGEYIDMTDLFERGLANKKNLKVFALHEDWTDVGRPEDYKKISLLNKNN